jgi:hypothetical protein
VPLGRQGSSGGHGLWSRHLTPAAAGGWSDLTAGLIQMREDLKVGPGRIHFALLPPLVQVRRIELPRLADDTLRQVLTRDSSRYFAGVRAPQVIGIRRLAPGRRSPMTYLVTSADALMVESLFASAAEAGWTVESVVSAYSAWESASCRMWPELKRAAGQVCISGNDRTEVLQLERGRLALVRRFSASSGAEQPAAPLSRTLDSPEATAAQAAGNADGPDLLPDQVRAGRQQRAGRLSARLLTAAAALLLITAGIEAWGVHRELAEVESRRAALKQNVSRAMVVREEMGQLDARLRVLLGAEAARSQWARTLVSVAEYLPSDAHLVGFRGSADSVVLEGEAERASLVFESLQKAPGVLSVRADAPIRQEARDSGPAVERFTLAARLERR